MPQYAWKALNPEGRTVSGKTQAVDEAALFEQLEQSGQMPIKAREIKPLLSIGKPKVGLLQLLNFSFQTSMMLKAGVPILDTLRDIAQAEGNSTFQQVIMTLAETLTTGKTLSQAMSMHPRVFDNVYINLVRAGEQTGQLTEVLEDLTETLKWQHEMASQTRKALTYPAIVLVVVTIVMLFMLGYVVPQIAQLLKTMRIPLPLPTRVLIVISDFISHHWLALIGGLMFLGIGLPALSKMPGPMRSAFDRFKLHIPLVGDVLRRIALARFAYVLAMLYAAGITVIEALKVVEKAVGNRAMADAVKSARLQIGKGKGLSAAFSGSEFFPPMVISMLRVGEATGSLDKALQNVSEMYSREARDSVESLQASLQPILTVVLGGLIAAIMAFTLGPLYESVIGTAAKM